MRISEYTLVDCGSQFDLSREVTKLIEYGWQPFGSPVIQCHPNAFQHYCQVMVKYVSE